MMEAYQVDPRGKKGATKYLHDSTPGQAAESSVAIAELYPETTVMFADIAGFTAW